MEHKDKVDQLAKTDSKISLLINDLTYKDWNKMSPDEQVMIGKYNQDAIKQIMQIKY